MFYLIVVNTIFSRSGISHFYYSILSSFVNCFFTESHDNCMSKQFVNDVASIAILATCWHKVPMPPLEGEVPNEREAEGFVRKLSKKTPQSARSGCQLPFQGSQGGCAAEGVCIY